MADASLQLRFLQEQLQRERQRAQQAEGRAEQAERRAEEERKQTRRTTFVELLGVYYRLSESISV